MKKLLLALLIAFSILALASCSLGETDGGGENNGGENIGGETVCQHEDLFTEDYEIAASCTEAGSYGEKLICSNCSEVIGEEDRKSVV